MVSSGNQGNRNWVLQRDTVKIRAKAIATEEPDAVKRHVRGLRVRDPVTGVPTARCNKRKERDIIWERGQNYRKQYIHLLM
jgi:hypothetical protein